MSRQWRGMAGPVTVTTELQQFVFRVVRISFLTFMLACTQSFWLPFLLEEPLYGRNGIMVVDSLIY